MIRQFQLLPFRLADFPKQPHCRSGFAPTLNRLPRSPTVFPSRFAASLQSPQGSSGQKARHALSNAPLGISTLWHGVPIAIYFTGEQDLDREAVDVRGSLCLPPQRLWKRNYLALQAERWS
jgi:hypothetical protein